MFLLSFTIIEILALVLKLFLFLFRFYNGCVVRNVLQATVSHMTT